MPKLTKEERETIIRFDDSAKTCEIYTCSPTVARKLTKRGYQLVPDKPWGFRARGVPLKAISFRRLESLTKAEGAARRRGNPTWLKKTPDTPS